MTNYQHADGTISYAYSDPPIYQPDTTITGDQGGPKPRYIVRRDHDQQTANPGAK